MPTTTKKTTTKNRRQNSDSRQKNIGVRLFENGTGQRLLVPTEGVWLFKQERTSNAVLHRMGLIVDKKRPRKIWEEWQRKYPSGLLDYLNGKPMPDNMEFITPCGHRKYAARDGRVFIDSAMLRFQHGMTIRATCEHLVKQGTPAGSISNLLKAFAGFDWFRPWLLFNEPIPPSANVTVVSHPHVTACRNALAYLAIGESCKTRIQGYGDWIQRFPQDQLFDWLLWLFGASIALAGWYVVPDWITDVRQRMSPEGIRAAAGNSSSFAQKINSDPELRQAFDDAVTAFRRMKEQHVEKHLEEKSAAFHQLKRQCYANNKGDPRPHVWGKLKSTILRNAKASIFSVVLQDCGDGPNRSKWKGAVPVARDAGGNDLVNVLNRYAKGPRRKTDKAGVFDPGLFVPLPGMLRFRDCAKQLWVENDVAKVKKFYPPELFRRWFLYWVLPATLRD